MRKNIDGEPQKGQEMEKSGIIFDMDGTLWDSAKAVADSWTEVVAREYTPERVITEEEIKSVMGLTMDKLAEKIFPELPEERLKEFVGHTPAQVLIGCMTGCLMAFLLNLLYV